MIWCGDGSAQRNSYCLLSNLNSNVTGPPGELTCTIKFQKPRCATADSYLTISRMPLRYGIYYPYDNSVFHFSILLVFLLFLLCLLWPELTWFAGCVIVFFEIALLFCPYFSTTLAPWHSGDEGRRQSWEFHPSGKYQWFKINILSEISHYPAEFMYSTDKMFF